jgi:hypothetical protein
MKYFASITLGFSAMFVIASVSLTVPNFASAQGGGEWAGGHAGLARHVPATTSNARDAPVVDAWRAIVIRTESTIDATTAA